MKFRLFLSACLLVLFPVCRAATSDASVDLVPTGGNPIQFDFNTKETIVTGGARLTYGDLILTADEIRFRKDSGVATAHGHVVITHGDLRALADDGVYTIADGRLRLTNPRAGAPPRFFEGSELEGTLQDFTLTNAHLFFGEPGDFTPSLTAQSIHVVPGQRYEAHRASLRLAEVPLFAFPTFAQGLKEPPLDLILRAGYRGSIGAYLDVTALAPVSPGIRAGAEIGLFSSRGVLLGPAARYDVESGTDHTTGELRSGWIYDFGHRGDDVLGNPIDRQRGYLSWQHQQTVGDHLSVTAILNYWSDSEVIRDFERYRFSNDQQPDSFLEADYTGNNYVASGFLRVQPNDFYSVQQREPELRFDLLPLPLTAGVIQRGEVGFVHLREDAVGVGPSLESNRFDAFYSIERPWAATPWLTLTPVIGGRITHYFNALGGRSDYTRALGEFGFDLRARAYGTFDVKNPRWNIDGLRHLIEPFVQYRNVPQADKGTTYIPAIDRTVFDTRLPTLDLGDIRFLDDLHPLNTLRIGLDQRLQTRDAKGGSRDLVTLILAEDFRFARTAGERRASGLQADLAIKPASWLQFDAYQRFDPSTFALREFNSGLTLTDGQFWTARFGTQYLHGDLEEYTTAVRVRLNERFAVTGRWRYDARNHRMYEQSYGLRQNFHNLFDIEYQLAWTRGELRDSGFQVRVLLDVLKF